MTSCARCRFSDPILDADDEPVLLCRRMPPAPDTDPDVANWPAVCGDDWCGEFRPGGDFGSPPSEPQP